MNNDVLEPKTTGVVEHRPMDQVMSGDKMEPVREISDSGLFTEYENENGKPFVVDHYDLGTFWNRSDMYSRAYTDEVNTITTYLKDQVERGNIGNSREAAVNELKRIEKMNNVAKDARSSVRVGVVSEFIKFLQKTSDIRVEAAKYGKI